LSLAHLDRPFYLVAAGKAARPMARAFLQVVDRVPRRAMVAGPRVDAAGTIDGVASFDAGHPFPNAASVAAATRALELASAANSDGCDLIVLLSGGASAMLTAPVAAITLDDKIAAARGLMNAGFAIGELNCVRKHLSRIKGGQLAAAAGHTLTIAISDVHGPVADDPSVIGSGPTVADPTTIGEAAAIAAEVTDLPDRVRAYLRRGAAGEVPETIKPGDPRLDRASYVIVGNRLTAIEGARAAAESLGYRVIIVERATQGEAREASTAFLDVAVDAARQHSGPVCVLAAGETTVTVNGRGRGGRNQEFVLAAVPSLPALGADVVLASIGTDGADGPTDAAGAIADRFTLERSVRAGLDWQSTLANNDAYHFFSPLGDLVRWGPTGTNVGDVQLFLKA
jgi:glycerate-2-kinase